jgi:hypothetical protein
MHEVEMALTFWLENKNNFKKFVTDEENYRNCTRFRQHIPFFVIAAYLYTMHGAAGALRAPQFEKPWPKALFLRL